MIFKKDEKTEKLIQLLKEKITNCKSEIEYHESRIAEHQKELDFKLVEMEAYNQMLDKVGGK